MPNNRLRFKTASSLRVLEELHFLCSQVAVCCDAMQSSAICAKMRLINARQRHEYMNKRILDQLAWLARDAFTMSKN